MYLIIYLHSFSPQKITHETMG